MNPLSNKFLGLFVILVVMLVTLTTSSPVQLDKRTPVLHVSAPGPGKRAIGSIQNVSWWCNECSSKGKNCNFWQKFFILNSNNNHLFLPLDKVVIKVKDGRGTFVTLTVS